MCGLAEDGSCFPISSWARHEQSTINVTYYWNSCGWTERISKPCLPFHFQNQPYKHSERLSLQMKSYGVDHSNKTS